MKKIAVFFSFLLIVLSCGCEKSIRYWTFEQGTSDIVEISIVEVDPESVNYDTVKDIDIVYADDVCEKISSIPMELYGTNLKTQNGTGILVLFQNGEYDLITMSEPKHYRYDENMKLQGYNSWLKCCNADDFNNLINYLQELQCDAHLR